VVVRQRRTPALQIQGTDGTAGTAKHILIKHFQTLSSQIDGVFPFVSMSAEVKVTFEFVLDISGIDIVRHGPSSQAAHNNERPADVDRSHVNLRLRHPEEGLEFR
jgi:hypothetical protein